MNREKWYTVGYWWADDTIIDMEDTMSIEEVAQKLPKTWDELTSWVANGITPDIETEEEWDQFHDGAWDRFQEYVRGGRKNETY
jgi:hypothetical protein